MRGRLRSTGTGRSDSVNPLRSTFLPLATLKATKPGISPGLQSYGLRFYATHCMAVVCWASLGLAPEREATQRTGTHGCELACGHEATFLDG